MWMCLSLSLHVLVWVHSIVLILILILLYLHCIVIELLLFKGVHRWGSKLLADWLLFITGHAFIICLSLLLINSDWTKSLIWRSGGCHMLFIKGCVSGAACCYFRPTIMHQCLHVDAWWGLFMRTGYGTTTNCWSPADIAFSRSLLL